MMSWSAPPAMRDPSRVCSIQTLLIFGIRMTWFRRSTLSATRPDKPGLPDRRRIRARSWRASRSNTALESLEELTGRKFDTIRVVGGGARNRLLNQFTADATGRTVIAGPSEATALGNIAMQMLATGAVTSLSEARAIIEHSFPVERYFPTATDQWEPHYQRFREYIVLRPTNVTPGEGRG
jgi:hypothetical protein